MIATAIRQGASRNKQIHDDLELVQIFAALLLLLAQLKVAFRWRLLNPTAGNEF